LCHPRAAKKNRENRRKEENETGTSRSQITFGRAINERVFCGFYVKKLEDKSENILEIAEEMEKRQKQN
jgi:hypothetical protein